MAMGKGKYSAKAIANYIIEHAKNVSPMKLQKLVYFAHGWYLAYKKEPLIIESVEVWDYGPVVRELYDTFKAYGNKPIDEPAEECDWSTGETYVPRIDEKDEFVVSLLDAVIKMYGRHSAIKLSQATHEDGTPWLKAKQAGNGIISDQSIQEYFEGVLETVRQSA